MDQPDEALAAYARSVALRRDLIAGGNEGTRYREGLMRILWQLGPYQHERADLAAAAGEAWKRHRALAKRLADEPPALAAHRADAANVASGLAQVRQRQGRVKEAMALSDEAHAVMVRINAAQLEPSRYLTVRAAILKRRAAFQSHAGQVKEAVETSRHTRPGAEADGTCPA